MAVIPDLKILLAEDNLINQRLIVIILKQMGIFCDIASNGKTAFEMYQQNGYDLILMDLQMPELDGVEATRLIRAFEKNNNLKHPVSIVALTGNAIIDKKEVCIEVGMDDFIEKPLQEKKMRLLLSKFSAK